MPIPRSRQTVSSLLLEAVVIVNDFFRDHVSDIDTLLLIGSVNAVWLLLVILVCIFGLLVEQIFIPLPFFQFCEGILLWIFEEAHSVGDSDQDNLRDVDLHEDEELVESAEDVADARHVDPLVSVQAEQVLSLALHLLPVDDEVAGGDRQDRADAEEDVGTEKESRLVFEEILVIAKRVVLASCLERFFVLFNLVFDDKVTLASEVEVVELLEHDDADESDKVRWIDSRVALLD